MNTPVHRDTEGKPFTYIDLMYDLSALYEMNFYEKDGNYDDISAFAMLALWLNHEANYLAMYGELDEDVEQETEFDELELVAFALSDDIYG